MSRSKPQNPKSKSKNNGDAAATVEPQAAPGPRMQCILEAEIAPWNRDELSDEEAQLREIKRIPVRHVFGTEEARKRLATRSAQNKRRISRTARPKSTATAS